MSLDLYPDEPRTVWPPRQYLPGDIVTVDSVRADDIPPNARCRVDRVTNHYVWVKVSADRTALPVRFDEATLVERDGVRGDIIRTAEHAARQQAERRGFPLTGWQARRDIITDERLHVSAPDTAAVYYFTLDGLPIGFDSGSDYVGSPLVEPTPDVEPVEPRRGWVRSHAGRITYGVAVAALTVPLTVFGGLAGVLLAVILAVAGYEAGIARQALDDGDVMEASHAAESAFLLLLGAVATAWVAGGWTL